MKTGTKIVLGVIAILAIIAALVVGKYNSLLTLEEEVNSKYATIDTQLQRRVDLIPNLVNTVKGFANHEEEIITNISDARTRLLSANNADEAAKANQELTSALNNLFVIVENYPDLKANQNFLALQDELAGTENRIAVARVDYNDAVAKYNKTIKIFPNNLIGGMFGLESKNYFQANENANEVPNVSFE